MPEPAAPPFPTLADDIARVQAASRRRSGPFALTYPLTAVVAGVGAWYALIYALGLPEYVLPGPDRVLAELASAPGLFVEHGVVTVWAALGGFLLSLAIGIPIAIAIAWSEPLGRAVMPLLIFSQTMPKVAIAPLFILWFGFGLLPKIVIAFLISFFPVVISMATGLLAVEIELLELVRSMSATKAQVFLRARLPTSLPYLFSGLKVSITLCVIGAIVGEFVGANRGLGYLVLWANGQTETALLFAVLVVLAVIGYLLYAGVSYLEGILLPWHVAVRAQQEVRDFTS
jgi:NitT/TauT family transport system permease protein